MEMPDVPTLGLENKKLGVGTRRGREEQGAGESAACRQKWQPAAAAGDGSLSTVSLTSVGVWGSTWDPRPHCGT